MSLHYVEIKKKDREPLALHIEELLMNAEKGAPAGYGREAYIVGYLQEGIRNMAKQSRLGIILTTKTIL